MLFRSKARAIAPTLVVKGLFANSGLAKSLSRQKIGISVEDTVQFTLKSANTMVSEKTKQRMEQNRALAALGLKLNQDILEDELLSIQEEISISVNNA